MTGEKLQWHPVDVTVTFVCNRYPRELFRHLRAEYGIVPVNAEAGIYYLDGSTFPMQIIINHQLDPRKYLWLYSLRGNLNEDELLAVLNDYEENKEEKRYQSAMELILRANWELAGRLMNVCQTLEELLTDKLKAGSPVETCDFFFCRMFVCHGILMTEKEYGGKYCGGTTLFDFRCGEDGCRGDPCSSLLGGRTGTFHWKNRTGTPILHPRKY